jgi:hypothetical protein
VFAGRCFGTLDNRDLQAEFDDMSEHLLKTTNNEAAQR